MTAMGGDPEVLIHIRAVNETAAGIAEAQAGIQRQMSRFRRDPTTGRFISERRAAQAYRQEMDPEYAVGRRRQIAAVRDQSLAAASQARSQSAQNFAMGRASRREATLLKTRQNLVTRYDKWEAAATKQRGVAALTPARFGVTPGGLVIDYPAVETRRQVREGREFRERIRAEKAASQAGALGKGVLSSTELQEMLSRTEVRGGARVPKPGFQWEGDRIVPTGAGVGGAAAGVPGRGGYRDVSSALLGTLKKMPREQRYEWINAAKISGSASSRELAKQFKTGTAQMWQQAAARLAPKVTMGGDITRTPFEKIKQFVEWRAFRYASLLIFYYGLIQTLRTWKQIGWEIVAANEKSQTLSRTWAAIGKNVRIIAQGTATAASPAAAILGSLVETTTGTFAALSQSINDAVARAAPDKKAGLLHNLGNLFDMPAFMLHRFGQYATGEGYKDIFGTPGRRMPRPMEDPYVRGKAAYQWAEGTYKLWRGEKALNAELRITAELESEIRKQEALAGEGTTKWYQLVLERRQIEYRRQQLIGEAAGGRAATNKEMLAQMYHNMIQAGVPESLKLRRLEKETWQGVVAERQKAVAASEASGNKYGAVWIDEMNALSEAKQKLLPTAKDILREAFGISPALMARAGVGAGLLGKLSGYGPSGFPIPSIARTPAYRNVGEYVIKFAGFSERDQELILQQITHRLIVANRAGGN